MKTDSPENEEVSDTVLATSIVADKHSALVLWFLWIQKTLKIVNIMFIVIIYLFCLF